MVRCSVADPDPGRIRIQSGPLIRIQWARKVEKIRNLKKNFIKKNPFNSRFENFVFKQFLKVWIRIEKKMLDPDSINPNPQQWSDGREII